MHPQPDDLCPADLSIPEAARRLRVGTLTAAELVDACLRRIEERNGGAPSFDGGPGSVNAWVRTYDDDARAAAAEADHRLAQDGPAAPLLCGIPLGLKDLFAVAGRPLTGSSRVLEGNVAVSDSAAWARLRADGAILLGHTHTHEFAAGGTTDQVGNPWDLTRSAGGSSGGSAAALAAGMALGALGTDTAGSLRIPAALCGVSAFKPSFGRVPMAGVIPLAPTLDHAGPLGRNLAACSALLMSLTRAEQRALQWNPRPPHPLELPLSVVDAPQPLSGVTLALTDRPEGVAVDEEVLEGLARAAAACRELGADVVELPAAPDLPRADYDVILLSESRSWHARHADVVALYRGSTREFLDHDAPSLPVSAYLEAQERRVAVTGQWREWFRVHSVDAILEPTAATTAPERGRGYDPGREIGGTDPLTCFTATWNVTGFPVAALPTHIGSGSGLPVGVSLIGPAGEDARLMGIGLALQQQGLVSLPDPVAH